MIANRTVDDSGRGTYFRKAGFLSIRGNGARFSEWAGREKIVACGGSPCWSPSATALKKLRQEIPATLPSFGWLVVFVLVPTLLVLAIAFRETDPAGGIGAGWTLDQFRIFGQKSTLHPALAHPLDQRD